MAEQLGSLARTHTCGALRAADVGADVVLLGWVQKVRDLGAIIFLDVRDRHGVTQVVVQDDVGAARARQAAARRVRRRRPGRVEQRAAETVNAKLPTGEIEVRARGADAAERGQDAAVPRSAKSRTSRRRRGSATATSTCGGRRCSRTSACATASPWRCARYFDEQGFWEIETPILTKSTPEGARDFLVPSRVHPGEFYALPQSPQIFKQILMIAGMDKYVQIARCFRDEALRADRQLEFTQVDLEMAFARPEMVFEVVEGALAACFREIGVEIATAVPPHGLRRGDRGLRIRQARPALRPEDPGRRRALRRSRRSASSARRSSTAARCAAS